jgi:hypothetical protein
MNLNQTIFWMGTVRVAHLKLRIQFDIASDRRSTTDARVTERRAIEVQE